ncbi:Aspartate aminotransferase (AspB-4) [Dehalobacter sp. UNSWDHB]|jgi:Transcriptional regulators containing a DNA-binding HTH domain and an aminotransferase domain (MocR family) and their eukaryotic orthologs|uniref:aminotransferase-like domain-containing protein n=1 Tax=unclassified Dehalobacter TaxID=2635733 RepID=UPI00028B8F11|nr:MULTISPECIES: PLP-dependent aminotransferase family protein [unclassified Dehalobacter]AFV01741.1 Transcriptional regulators containing a DNA-binding HTH domain and an aminotransferase domain (MocR family) [Dehalobacter sp. DCA]EQB19849.1 Aspartate aminotransferase (AspB-4) [Dehalobacter sp. UNSWDHB]
MEYNYAKRINHLKASEIREILKVTENPEIISFAGGLPAPELFPVDEIKEVSRIVLEEAGTEALQYTTTEGYLPLRKWIAARMNNRLGTQFEPDNILLTHGSQQALDLSGKVFLDEGDVVLCESPTYLAAISAFKAYGCEFKEVPTDEEGMIPAELDRILDSTPNVKLIYVIPDFQNPTGRTWTLPRREHLVKAAMKHQVMIIEDNPYGELRFEDEPLPSLQAFDHKGCVLSLGTFSKIFCPGYRIGWVAGDQKVVEKYVLVKQGTDLQCNTLAQREIAKYLEMYNIDEHIEKIRKVYKRRRNLTVKLMEDYFPEGVTFTRPKGGLFAWIELPANVNARDVLIKSLEQNVAFVPGGSFFPNGGRENTFRINFSNMPDDKIEAGLQSLAGVLREFV